MRIFVLFNLKPGTDVDVYEEWARKVDLPGVGALVSVRDFRAYRTTGLLGSDGEAPYQYIQIIDVMDMEGFQRDIDSDAVRKLLGEFEGFADAPAFILTEAVSEVTP